jgi:hypothetical protein
MALTWQNVSPSNPAGILQAGNMAAASIAKGLSTVGDSMQQYAGDTKDAETGKLLLMLDNAKDRNERQSILETADRAYIDESIIAKDNQAFDAREQQQQNILFNQGIQTDAANRDITAKAFQRENTLQQNAATQENRRQTFAQTEAKNLAETNQRDYLNSLRKTETEQKNTLYGIELGAAQREEKLAIADDNLVSAHGVNLAKASESIQGYTDYYKVLETAKIRGSKSAEDLMDQVATSLYKGINRRDLFDEGVVISDKLRSITGGTIKKNQKNQNYNIKVFSDKLQRMLMQRSWLQCLNVCLTM